MHYSSLAVSCVKNARTRFSVGFVHSVLVKVIGDEAEEFSSRAEMVADGRLASVPEEDVD